MKERLVLVNEEFDQGLAEQKCARAVEQVRAGAIDFENDALGGRDDISVGECIEQLLSLLDRERLTCIVGNTLRCVQLFSGSSQVIQSFLEFGGEGSVRSER